MILEILYHTMAYLGIGSCAAFLAWAWGRAAGCPCGKCKEDMTSDLWTFNILAWPMTVTVMAWLTITGLFSMLGGGDFFRRKER